MLIQYPFCADSKTAPFLTQVAESGNPAWNQLAGRILRINCAINRAMIEDRSLNCCFGWLSQNQRVSQT